MITGLGMENFKSWRSIADMRLAPITGLFGTNSSGKTSIIQLLLMLKQTVDSTDRAVALDLGDDRSLVALGTLRDILYQHSLEEALTWSLIWSLQRWLVVEDPEQPGQDLLAGTELSFHAEVAAGGEAGEPVVRRLGYELDGQTFAMVAREKPGEYDFEVEPAGPFHRKQRYPARPDALLRPVKSYGFPDQVNAHYQHLEFLADLVLEYEQLFDRLHYLGPLREHPQRQYTWGGTRPQDVGPRGERVVEALLAARGREQKVGANKLWPLEKYVAVQLRKLGLIDSFSVAEVAPGSNLYQVRVRRTPGSTEVLLTDVGFGVSQILPVIVLCYYVPAGSIVVLEQPEIHLHPSVQAGLADVLIDAVKVNGIQVIVESHSEHLLQRLQRRIAEQAIGPDDVALYFCDLVDGESRLTGLQVNDLGYITNWPVHFFGDPLGEAVAMTEAGQRRLAGKTR